MDQNGQSKHTLPLDEIPYNNKSDESNYTNEEDDETYYSIINTVICEALDEECFISVECDTTEQEEPDGVETFYDCDTDEEKEDFTLKDHYIDDRDHPELEYVYEPGINLAAMEFARNLVEVRQPIGHCNGCRCGEQASPGHCSRCHCSQESDLELAAELGKTLLESNKDLENSLKQQQSVIEDKAQEILFLRKQSLALKEVNDSQLRIYEQLEISIAELEKTNCSLLEEANIDKQRIKGLFSTVGVLETKCEKLQHRLNEVKERERKRKLRERQRAIEKETMRNCVQETMSMTSIDRVSSSSEYEEENLHRLQLSNEFWERTYEDSIRPSSLHIFEDNRIPSCLRVNEIVSSDEIRYLEKTHSNIKEESINIWRKEGDDNMDALTGEVSWLREESAQGNKRTSQLEAQIKVLLVENSRLLDQLESSGHMEDFSSVSSSTLDQEVLALQEMLCRRCLTRIEGLWWREIRRKFALWCVETWSGSPDWLDCWFILVTVFTLIGAIINTILTMF